MKITINQAEYELTERYLAGYQLSSLEARALDELRAERIRDWLARRERKLGQRLSQEEVERLAETWTWEAGKERSRRSDEIEQEARGMAELTAAGSGLAPGDPGWELVVAQEWPRLLEVARKRVEARRELLARELDALV